MALRFKVECQRKVKDDDIDTTRSLNDENTDYETCTDISMEFATRHLWPEETRLQSWESGLRLLIMLLKIDCEVVLIVVMILMLMIKRNLKTR